MQPKSLLGNTSVRFFINLSSIRQLCSTNFVVNSHIFKLHDTSAARFDRCVPLGGYIHRSMANIHRSMAPLDAARVNRIVDVAKQECVHVVVVISHVWYKTPYGASRGKSVDNNWRYDDVTISALISRTSIPGSATQSISALATRIIAASTTRSIAGCWGTAYVRSCKVSSCTTRLQHDDTLFAAGSS